MFRHWLNKLFPCPELKFDEPTSAEQDESIRRYTTMVTSGLRGMTSKSVQISNMVLIHHTMESLYKESFNEGIRVGYLMKQEEITKAIKDEEGL